MTYTHENLTLNVSTVTYNDFMGEGALSLNSNFVSELVENCCTFNEFFLSYQEEEFYNEVDQDTDVIARYYAEIDETIEVTNSDAIIAVFEYCLSEDKQFSLDISTENISWVIHDVLHAIHDAAGCTIYVESEIEKQRILTSLEITKKQFPNEMPNWEFLDNLEAEFYNRFKDRLCLEDFKNFEDEYSY
jgi:hypothetical protein